MKFRNRFITALVAAAAATLLISGTAFADGVIVAPGVVLPGQQVQTGPGGPGSESTAAGETQTAQTDQTQPAQTEQPAQTAPAADPGTAGPGAEGGETAAAASSETTAADSVETLIAKSLQDQYTLFPTSDPNIVVSRGRKIDLTKPILALTYDDGPQTEAGNRIIDTFDQYGQRATFFMVGDRVPSRAAEVQRMASEGHEIANHTLNHKYLNKVSAEEVRNQVVKCNDVLEQYTGIRPKIMRLPGGNKNDTVLKNVNMPIILWNVDTRDWEHRNAAKSVAAVIGKVKSGDVVLMHELYGATADATATIVPQLVEQGFQLVTVSEMAKIKGVGLESNRVYYSF